MLCLISFLAFSLIVCGNRTEECTSPSGENKIKVEYDYVSRPSVLYNDDCVWEYEGSRFNEDVFSLMGILQGKVYI